MLTKLQPSQVTSQIKFKHSVQSTFENMFILLKTYATEILLKSGAQQMPIISSIAEIHAPVI